MGDEKRKAAERVCCILQLSISSFILFSKAKLLEQMDEEFGVGNLLYEESEKRKQKVGLNEANEELLFRSLQRYAPKDLSGLRIEHSIEEFKEGQQVILTLKDRSM